ncbi:GntR family transcriptional regulator [Streptosporangium sp. NPDC023615]|uniref:GntR family transcriptional regulator n=1 Tax=Streptosporangium sp. NPDC023615 TaxID=3154794 RepID=UPI0034389C67
MTDAPPWTARSIADELRKKIENQRFTDNVVPGEEKLQEEYSVSLGTARKALGILRAEGLIETRQGKKTYIRHFERIIRHGQDRVGHFWEVDLEGRPKRLQKFASWQGSPSPDLAPYFANMPVNLAYRLRTYSVDEDQLPVQIALTRVPTGLFHDPQILLEEDTGPGGVFQRLADIGRAPVQADEFVNTRMPTPAEAHELKLRDGTPVFEIRRISLDEHGVPVDITDMILSSTAYTLHYNVLNPAMVRLKHLADTAPHENSLDAALHLLNAAQRTENSPPHTSLKNMLELVGGDMSKKRLNVLIDP